MSGPDSRRPRRSRVLTLCGAALLLWAGSTLSTWPSSVVASLAVTAPGLALPALAVVALAVPRRAWLAAGLATAAAVLPWTFVVGYASPGDDPVDPAAGGGTAPLRVMTFNAHLAGADAAEVVDVVRAEDVDVLVLVEAGSALTNRLAREGLASYLAPVHASANAGVTDGLVVYSRLPVRDFRDVEPGTDDALRAGPVATGVVETAAGPVHVVAAHTVSPVRLAAAPFLTDARPWRDDLRRVAAAARDAGTDGDPVVVLGDLNATPSHAPFRRLERDTGLEDAADLLGRGLRPTWPTLWDGGGVVALDHVLVSPGVAVDDVTPVVVRGSDHAAVVAALRLARQP